MLGVPAIFPAISSLNYLAFESTFLVSGLILSELLLKNLIFLGSQLLLAGRYLLAFMSCCFISSTSKHASSGVYDPSSLGYWKLALGSVVAGCCIWASCASWRLCASMLLWLRFLCSAIISS